MFDKQYRFHGKHALYVDKLTAVFDDKSKAKLFERNIDVYINAPLIGFLYRRMAETDNTKNPATQQVYNQNIMGDRVIYSQDDLMFNFRLIMLLDTKYEPDEENGRNRSASGYAAGDGRKSDEADRGCSRREKDGAD